MANPKVFEFAKEVGMETLALMAKIREWQLPIKSHMAELTPDMVEQIKNRLNPSHAEDAAKKLTVKKRATTKKTVPEAVATAAVAPGAVPKVVRRKATSESEAKKLESEQIQDSESFESHEEMEHTEELKTEVVVEAPVKAATETVKPTATVKAKSQVQQAPETEVEEVAPRQVEAPVAKEAKPEKVTPVAETKPVEPTPVVAKLEVEKTKKSNIVGQVTIPVPAAKSQKVEAPIARSATPAEEPEKKPAFVPSPARKKEVVVGQSGFASSQKPANEVVRKNIVGRMDLSRVSPPPSGAPQGRPQYGAQGQQRGGFQSGGYQGGGAGGGGYRPQAPGGPMRTAGRNNLRAGFVAQPIPVIPDAEELSRRSKFEDKHKKFTKPAQDTSNVTVPEEELVQFNSSEFRKREMVFQPKKKKGLLNRESLHTQITQPKASKRILKVNNKMKLSDAAEEMGLKAAQIIKVLMQNGVMANMNTDLDFDTLALVLPEFGWEAQNIFKTADEILEDTAFGDLQAEAIARPPVVTVMGHVDHGKTSLLDAIRLANVAAGEKGGITQHIGAYQVKLETGDLVTFLDTPGHEAFTAMRARGANATDIAVIVVAADDGVMPQTAEAINHAKAAGVPIVIAINKMDKPGANPDRIKQQLTEYEIVPEEWGGSNIFCEVSAVKKQGIKELLEQLLLVAEMQELRANPKRSGTGIVIESRLEKGRGSTATILVQDGTVAVGDLIVAGTSSGRVRSLMNDLGDRVDSAGPGMPVEVLGLDDVPGAGDKFDIVKDEKTMERVVELRKAAKLKADTPASKMTLEEIFSKVKQGDQKVLNVILKSDVMGSSEAILGMFQKLATDEVKVKVVHSAVGGINEGDVLLATTSKAIVLGFNTRPDGNAMALAKRRGVEIRTYGIVYEMMDDLKRLMAGLLEPEIVEQVHGRAEVRNIFTVPKIGTIGGCSVLDGKVARSHLVRLVRNGVVAYQGKIGSLKRFKDDAKEVAAGFECGIGIENYNDLKVGDIIEAYTREEIRRGLTENPASV
ncbi:MAG: translation initiation factor [Pseudomonadota bacterium]